ncbi:hypothetical protein LCGC14_2294850 [marine sediment metagenome]|uniref:Uncharacterized protein n=1 Tax=marine sediment metagenome TaxID=412755 RepID=A0A0F9DCR6_9ZZZZ
MNEEKKEIGSTASPQTNHESQEKNSNVTFIQENKNVSIQTIKCLSCLQRFLPEFIDEKGICKVCNEKANEKLGNRLNIYKALDNIKSKLHDCYLGIKEEKLDE